MTSSFWNGSDSDPSGQGEVLQDHNELQIVANR